MQEFVDQHLLKHYQVLTQYLQWQSQEAPMLLSFSTHTLFLRLVGRVTDDKPHHKPRSGLEPGQPSNVS